MVLVPDGAALIATKTGLRAALCDNPLALFAYTAGP